MTRVVVTGLGAITPLGTGVKKSWTNLISGKSGLISTTTLPDQPSWTQIPAKVVGKVPDWRPEDHLSSSEQKRLALFAQYGLVATEEALSDAKLDLKSMDTYDVGVNVGSGIGSFEDAYNNSVSFGTNGYKRVQPLFIPKLLTNMAAGNISIKYGLKGPNHAVATACATGLHSVGDAYNFIKNGYAKVMISGSSELSIHPLALGGFARAKSVVTSYNDSPELASRPFDKDRCGFVLGEGCGVLVVESLDHALLRGVDYNDIYGEIVGYGLSGDAHHITAPPSSGEGAHRAMSMAISRAGISPQQIDYVNAHATSTKLGDSAENNAIYSLFQTNPLLSISSNKSAIGHLLGAAGSVESVFSLLALKHNLLPPTLNLNQFDDESNYIFDYVPQLAQSKPVDYVLNNSFGFGGVNSSIVFRQYENGN